MPLIYKSTDPAFNLEGSEQLKTLLGITEDNQPRQLSVKSIRDYVNKAISDIDTSGVDKRLDDLEDNVDDLFKKQKELSDTDELLQSAISNAGKLATANQKSIETLNGSVGALNDAVNNLDSEINNSSANLTAKIDALSKRVGTAEGGISTNTESIEELRDELSEYSSSANGRISELESRLADVASQASNAPVVLTVTSWDTTTTKAILTVSEEIIENKLYVLPTSATKLTVTKQWTLKVVSNGKEYSVVSGDARGDVTLTGGIILLLYSKGSQLINLGGQVVDFKSDITLNTLTVKTGAYKQ